MVITLEMLNFSMLKKSSVRIYSYCRLRLDHFDQVQDSLLKYMQLLLSVLTEQKGKLLEIFEGSSGSGFVKRVNDFNSYQKVLVCIVLKTLKTQSVAQVLKHLKDQNLVRFLCWGKVCQN